MMSNIDIQQSSTNNLENNIIKAIGLAIDLLPSQGLISVFVHHNSLHCFEELTFEEATLEAKKVYGYECFMPESYYRKKMNEGGISEEDLKQILLNKYPEAFNQKIGIFGEKANIWKAMLLFDTSPPLVVELPWLLTETNILREFLSNVASKNKDLLINNAKESLPRGRLLKHLEKFEKRFGNHENWRESEWESTVVRLLWDTCFQKISSLYDNKFNDQKVIKINSTFSSNSTSELVNEILIRFCSIFVDQGFAQIPLPVRSSGFLKAFLNLYSVKGVGLAPWLKEISKECKLWLSKEATSIEIITYYLKELNISKQELDKFFKEELLSLKGWAGILWQLEKYSPWAPKRVPEGTLFEYLAVRLLLLNMAAKSNLKLSDLHSQSIKEDFSNEEVISKLSYKIFYLSQYSGWTLTQLMSASTEEWRELIDAVLFFDTDKRRVLFHYAFEKHFYDKSLSAIAKNAERSETKKEKNTTKSFQIVTCIDDREESFRRHLEEVDPNCETFAVAGFYAVAMYYHGSDEAHFRPLCPINVTPKHWVQEEPVFTACETNIRRTARRRAIGLFQREVHLRSKSILGGTIVGIFGSLAGIPMLARVLAPRLTAKIKSFFSVIVSKPKTELHIERETLEPGQDHYSLGFNIEEMTSIVSKVLKDISLLENYSNIVIFLGHGSSSVNNPHESAYNCGACSGGRGGPNARAFAQMANDHRVRANLFEQGINIPDHVHFIGGYHDTCRDTVEFYDLDQVPRSHREQFRLVEDSILKALTRNAHERCRRFGHEARILNRVEALEHVQERAEDLSQARPEYNHATNALCLVGRRKWSKGLFLDRRAFLMSYDSLRDDEDGHILEGILQAVIPVCAGINLEYYFSTVDSEGFGCGSKLPHNISGLAGVTTGAISDLRPGLSSQMVEIHEPIRIMFVIESSDVVMERIINNNQSIKNLVFNNWIKLVVFDPTTQKYKIFVDGKFQEDGLGLEGIEVKHASTSHIHYSRSASNLEFALIDYE